ncbi:uncharacterized protein [Apostichopus japonicus]|uniref:uncharacterized protein isoform X2 n=1 Tax=Stichopus japonicus TaxID=307972 RepID=UPI003AB4154B
MAVFRYSTVYNILGLLFLFERAFLQDLIICPSTAEFTGDEIECHVKLNTLVCLVCPVKKTTAHIIWKENTKKIFRTSVQKNPLDGISMGSCNDTLWSLNVEMQVNQTSERNFSCSYGNNASAKFFFKVKAEIPIGTTPSSINNMKDQVTSSNDNTTTAEADFNHIALFIEDKMLLLILIISGTVFFNAILTALCCIIRRHCSTNRETERRSLDMGIQITNSHTLQHTPIFDGSVTVDLDVTTDASPTLVRKRQSIMANYKFHIYSETCVNVGSLFEYRQGNFRTKDKKEHTCFAKSLRVPYTIYYEYLEHGSLQNFIMARYPEVEDKHSRLATKTEQQLEELLGFSCDIVKGMEFLVSQKFCHPVLCLRKVLLTGDGFCKIYDIRPIEMAIPKVEEELKKEYPPLPWLSPETLFLKEYTSACDVWSYAVLLWEIFSLGKVPHAGLDKLQVEENIRQSNVLNQPSCCPGSIYNMMLTCWNMSAAHRLTFGDIASQLVGTLGDIQKMNQVKEECGQIPTYYVLDMDGNV